MSLYETCRDNLEDLKTQFSTIDKSALNEANTRFKLIDSILTKCLGWEREDISCEDSYEGKYSDYTLSLFRSVGVLEAKKTGIYFELPVGKQNLFQPLKSVYKDNANIRAAIDQVKGYCQDRAIPMAIVSNGWQFLAFIANRNDSIPPLEGNAFIVPSLDSALNEFKEFWNCLSKSGFEEEYLFNKLVGNSEKELPPKLSSTIYGYPGIKNRNPFQTELEIISDLVFEDVIREEGLEKDFLENCYCKSGALSSYSLVSKAILSTRYSYLFEVGDRKATLQQVATKKGVSEDLVDLFANSLSKRPVLLVGDVGVGKSTFIDYLRLVEAPRVFQKAISFKVDLGSRAIITLDVRKAIIDVLKSQLLDEYNIDIEEDDFVRHCYHVELENFKKNVKVKRLYEINPSQALEKEIEFLSDKIDNSIQHLKKALSYICKNHRKQIIVFIDNCDQRNDQDQEMAFLVSQEFAADWPMIVFLSIRPETYHRTKRESGALSGYHTKAFTIPPPRLDEVIMKRLDFALKITSGDVALSKLDSSTSFSKLNVLIGTFKESLASNASLLTFLNNISNENIRKAIELVKKFFGSGHVDMEKIYNIAVDSGEYWIPVHELVRSVIYSDNIHYSSSNSEIVNFLEVRHFLPNEHFIIPIFISLLDDYSKNSRNSGFVSIKEVFSYLQGVGYNPTQIDSVLNLSYSKGLFETSQKGDRLSLENNQLNVRATNLGIYHLRFLLNTFAYMDAIIVDTPIFDSEFRDKIHDVTNVDLRLKRALIFKKYLDKQWEVSGIETNYFSWPKFSNEIESDIDRIIDKLERKKYGESLKEWRKEHWKS